MRAPRAAGRRCGREPSVRRPRVCRLKSESCRSWPNEQHRRSAICRRSARVSRRRREGSPTRREGGTETHLEHVEQDVELDRLLPSHAVVHLARVRHLVQEDERAAEDGRLDEVALVRQAQRTLARRRSRAAQDAHDVVRLVRDEPGEGGKGAQGEDRERVEKRVEADEDAEDDDLRAGVGPSATFIECRVRSRRRPAHLFELLRHGEKVGDALALDALLAVHLDREDLRTAQLMNQRRSRRSERVLEARGGRTSS